MTTSQALVDATQSGCEQTIVVDGDLTNVPSFALAPGQNLTASSSGGSIAFAPGSDGVQITQDNRVSNLRLATDTTQRAVYNDTTVENLGEVALHDLQAVGQVQLLIKDDVSGGDVKVDGLDVVAADTSAQTGLVGTFFAAPLEAMQGAFTLWNSQSDPSVVVTADLQDISIGRPDSPVRGSGVFVTGAFPLFVDADNVETFGDTLHQQSVNPSHGSIEVNRLTTGDVHTQGSTTFYRGNAVGGSVAVFDGPSAPVAQGIKVKGSVTTAGLTNGGINIYSDLDKLKVADDITSTGPNGFGVVTWPHIGSIDVDGRLETFGTGSRAFNAYAGEVAEAEFGQIVTHGDGGVGVDVFRPIGKLVVHRGIQTSGGTGTSLVLGVLKPLQASAIGAAELNGAIDKVYSGGPISTSHADVSTVHVGAENSIGSLCATRGVQSDPAGLPFDAEGKLRLSCDSADSTPYAGFAANMCVATDRFAYGVAGLSTERIVRVDVHVDGTKVKTVSEPSIDQVVVTNLPQGPFDFNVTATTDSGAEVRVERTYYGCSA
ncbi:hypothetical protein [Nocardioides sp. NPDC000441]|uniref:hypothetical protein n=1 Tax=Nocardioides sp. NPDC000441 TaxID=3154256 RepID=UPI00331813D8